MTIKKKPTMNLKLYQIDAFTDRPFSGNPAAVCILDEWLPTQTMQSIAEENNLSETAFAVKNDNVYEIRWFTPNTEVDLCGHATLATAFVIFNYYDTDANALEFHSSRSGSLYVKNEEHELSMNFPVDQIREVDSNSVLNQALKRAPIQTWKGKTDYVLVYESQEDIEMLNPDFSALSKVDARGIVVTAPGSKVDFVSRFFGPQVGVNEDPVTGSAHTSLTPYWANVLKKNELVAKQVSSRGGDLKCESLEDRVKISGNAKLYMIGEIYV